MTSVSSTLEKLPLQSWAESSPPPARYWAFYVRVTSEESVKKDLSIPNQCRRAIEIAMGRGWHDYRIYVEPVNVSAELWTDKRPAFKQLLDDVAAGHVIGICARHTDRLWRNNDVLGKLINVLRPHGVELWDFNSLYEYKSAHGKFSLQVLGAASELEVGLTAERIREMKRGKALKGKTSGGPPPFGYTSQSHRKNELLAQGVSPDDAYRQACLEYPIGKTWYVHEDEALVVRLVFELYTGQTRYGSKRIARHLNMAGYQRRTAGPFVHVAVMHILNNPVYAGYTSYDEAAYERRLPSKLPRHKQTFYKGEHRPIIDSELWYKAQEIKATESKINRMRNVSEGESGTAETFSLTGILKCPSCGGGMHGKWTNRSMKNREGYRYYFCGNRHDGGPEACAFPAIPAMPLQDAAWNWLHEILSSPEFVMEHVERMQKKMKAEQPDGAKRLAALRKQRDTLKGSIAKYFRVFEACPDPDVAVLERVRELRLELQNVEAKITNLEARNAPFEREINPERVKYYLQQLRERIADRTDVQRVVFHELKRSHDFEVRASPTGREFTLSLALPSDEMLGSERSEKRLVSVLAIPGEKLDRQIVREVSGSSDPPT